MKGGRSRRRRLWQGAAALAAGSLGCAGLAAAVAAPASAAAGCQVQYTKNDWGTGFTTAITLTNTGSPITSWTLTYSYTGNQTLSNGWSGTWTQSGKNITVTNASWNGTLGTGATASFGAQFAYTGTNTDPTSFAINGVTCGGGSPPPTSPPPTSPPPTSPPPTSPPPTSPPPTSPPPTSPPPGNGPPMVSISSPTAGQIFTPGSTVALQAAPVTGAGNVTSVSFFDSTSLSNNNLIGTATSAPFTVQWTNVPAGSYSLTAVATNGSESLTSYPVAIKVEAPTVVVNPTNVTVAQGSSTSFGVSLSSQPTSSVTVSVAQNSGGDSDLSVSSGASLTFTTSNWSVPQKVTVASGSTAANGGSQGTFSASATGFATGSVTVTEALAAGSQSTYDQWFMNLYDTMMNPNNGYFSPKGIPYHSVETLIVEAPDYGHETTSETYSYYLWLQADYGRVTGNWTPFNNAWANMEQFMIPNDANQPGQGSYPPNSPAQYGPEEPLPSNYPVALNASVPVGSDPIAAELKTTYGTGSMYQPFWIMDVDNRYGFGQQEDGSSTPSWINTFQRGPMESVWDTIPQPDWDALKSGGPNGFLDLFNNGGGSFTPQYKYTDAPDADARMIQAAFWADTYAKAQGKSSAISATLAKAAKLGDYLRYSMFDKYFKQISANCSQQGSVACPAGTSKANEDTFLLSWFDAWGGATNGSFAWRVGGTSIHEGYQNPLAAFALSTDTNLIPLSPTAKSDWATSLTTQLNLMKWLQSAEGGIAGGVENNWQGNYGDAGKPPAGDPTFDGMYYDSQPQYHNPPSNQWFGYQAWPMERVAEYYQQTGNTEAQSILTKWVSWVESVVTVNTTAGTFCLPGKQTWTGQPDSSFTTGTSSTTVPAANTGLHVSVTGCSEDIGVATSLAKALTYFAAKSGDTTAQALAQNLLDVIHKFMSDSLGYSAPETRDDYINFTSKYDNTKSEGVFVPSSFSGHYPGNIPINSSTNTFLSIRPWYIGDPAYSKVQAFLNGGAVPTFSYHRFWAEADIATAFDAFAKLFPNVAPPAGF